MRGFLISSLAKTDASAFTENILPMVSSVPVEKILELKFQNIIETITYLSSQWTHLLKVT